MRRATTRRDFLKVSGLAGVSIMTLGSRGADTVPSPNAKLNIGVVGCGGKGHSDMQHCSGENIVALCDVDAKQAEAAKKEQPKANFYKDYRQLLEKEKNIDACVVATPDHMHAPVSLSLMKLKKHVYCQKPLVHDVWEAREMRRLAKEMGVVTQMGNQGSSENGLRRAVEIIQAGGLGPVRQVHVWSNRPIWPQGLDRPKDVQKVPETLDWDLWLGSAPERPYNECYCPFKWRGWWDFGTGALGDMACHTANMPFRALKLEYPTSIEAETSGVNPESPPKWSRIRFEFPARGDMPALTFFWTDGGQKPPPEVTSKLDLTGVKGGKKKKKVEDLKPGDIPGSGCLVVGDKGTLFSPDDYGAAFKIFPEEEYESYKGPAESIPRIGVAGQDTDKTHHLEWIDCIKNNKQPYSNFGFAALLTETILLGNLALRTGKKLEWDGPNMVAKNCPEASKFVRRDYRKGFTV